MRYSLFEQAATEAGICAKEIDGEIEELKARKQVLEALMQHLSMALPMLGRKAGAATPDASSGEAAPAPSTSGENAPESMARVDPWSNFMSAIGAPSSGSGQTVQASGLAALSFANPVGIRERVLSE